MYTTPLRDANLTLPSWSFRRVVCELVWDGSKVLTIFQNPLVFMSAVLGLGIFAQWLAWRFRFPSILMLLAVGFLLGFFCGDNPDWPGQTITDEVVTERLLFPLVALSVGVIMFEGGLTLRFHELADAGSVVLRLVTIGVLVTWVLAAIAAHYVAGMSWDIAALLGAILTVTGPTVIAPLLRHVRPFRRIGAIVKWEGIVIDPIGAVLAVLVFNALFAGSASEVGLILTKIVGVGVLIGMAFAFALVTLMRRYLIPDYLHNAVFLATALVAFAISDQIVHESGLLTVTIMGVALANQRSVAVKHVAEFKENLRVLLISCLFILLAARIRYEDVMGLGWQGLAFVLLLIVVVRPVSVLVATIGAGLSLNERIFLSFLAPRGIVAAAVSSVFALEVTHHFAEHHVTSADSGVDQIVPLTFLVIVVTVAVYGLSAAPLARALKLATANPQGVLIAGGAAWVRQLARLIQDEGIPVIIVDTNYHNISSARIDGIRAHCASIISEYMEVVDLGGIGRLLALTPNDNLNTLAAAEFTNVFGRVNVYQLAYSRRDVTEGHGEANGPHMSGRFLFGPGQTYTHLASSVATGSTFKKTRISEEFTFADFQERYGKETKPLFVLDENERLLISTVEEPLTPKPGQSVIALVRPNGED